MSRMQELWNNSYLSGNSMSYVDSLYEDFLVQPDSVPEEWQKLFKSMQATQAQDVSIKSIEDYFRRLSAQRKTAIMPEISSPKQTQVMDLVNAYRSQGHLNAKLDPLEINSVVNIPCLNPSSYGLSLDDPTTYQVSSSISEKPLALKNLVDTLNRIYCSSLGFEYTYISDDVQKKWWQERIERQQGRFNFSPDQKRTILSGLIAADGFERYLHTRFVGQKRFSLEGGDALIPMMTHLMTQAAHYHVKEAFVGMAHRGRLNILINVMGKSPQSLYDEFEGKGNYERTGDVKYHLGYSSRLDLGNQQSIDAFLAFNPSHLEIISPVVEGAVRSRQTIRKDLLKKDTVLPILIHGDSAFTGQGVVMETFNFSQARSYSTGGTVHIVINNQVGFTTNDPHDTRSSHYCTDIAKMIEAPVIHVNGDDPEAVIFATNLALDYRMQFHRDVVIDLVCYRRQGHNEADEAAITQPLMYKIIRSRPVLRDLYAKALEQQQVITSTWYQEAVDSYRQKMDKGESLVPQFPKPESSPYRVNWKKYYNTTWQEVAKTGVDLSILQQCLEKISVVPDHFTLHPVVERTRQERLTMLKGEQALNWGCAETLAFGTLLQQGYEVRLSGQDCGRGTFSHRHAVWHDQTTEKTYIPLETLAQSATRPFTVIDSVLSEEAVLAFEYGYAATNPEALVIWEGQFGDFANGAQVVIDQFISSGEQKWGRLCGLMMFLPHGYEGQGPEHSSARLERFMQLCAQQNMQVCVPSTPAQIFHLLRRQMLRPYRKPLIVMTPKSLLRHKRAVSSLDELVHGQFQNVLPEIETLDASRVKKLVLCSGKVYYDLLQAREDRSISDVAILRIEQLYPFPTAELKKQLEKYPNVVEVIWCQEEPQNQGAWFTSQHHMLECLNKEQHLRYAGREFAAAPAVGSYALHLKQQQAFIEDVFAS